MNNKVRKICEQYEESMREILGIFEVGLKQIWGECKETSREI